MIKTKTNNHYIFRNMNMKLKNDYQECEPILFRFVELSKVHLNLLTSQKR